jgi:hypothetical protein
MKKVKRSEARQGKKENHPIQFNLKMRQLKFIIIMIKNNLL